MDDAQNAGSTNGKFFGGQRRGSGRRPRTGADVPRESGPDGLAAEYERGPFVALPVPDFSAGAIALLERRTGKIPDPAVLAEWERIRAFTGYPGVNVTPQIAARAMLVDPEASRAGAVVRAPGAEKRTRIQERVRELTAPRDDGAEEGPPSADDLGEW